MRIKQLDREHLLLVLSRQEKDFLGLYPGMEFSGFHTKYVLLGLAFAVCGEIWPAAQISGTKVRTFFHSNGTAAVLFSTVKKKRYRLAADQRPYVCIFQDCDAYIAFMEQARLKKLPEDFHVFLHGDDYIAVPADRVFSSETKVLLSEFGSGKRISVHDFAKLLCSRRVL